MGHAWIKPLSMSEMLPHYRFVVMLDSDAIFNNPELPLEWLMNYWKFTPETSLAVSGDYAGCTDTRGVECDNTGFLLAQHNNRTMELLDAWMECPTGGRYPGCADFATRFTLDQAAFNEYIRAEFNQTTDIVHLNRIETNGFWADSTGNRGIFISHFWNGRDRVKEGVGRTVMRALTARLHGFFLGHKEDLVEDWESA